MIFLVGFGLDDGVYNPYVWQSQHTMQNWNIIPESVVSNMLLAKYCLAPVAAQYPPLHPPDHDYVLRVNSSGLTYQQVDHLWRHVKRQGDYLAKLAGRMEVRHFHKDNLRRAFYAVSNLHHDLSILAAQVENINKSKRHARHMNTFIRQIGAEMIGTFALVFAGTSAIVVNQSTGGVVGHVGVALTFGLIVSTMIAALGDVSGAHFNPAVTLGFRWAGRIDRRTLVGYILSQCIGAILASVVVRMLFTAGGGLGQTVPSGSVMQSFVLEVLLTAALIFVILNVSTGAKEKGLTAGMAIGGIIALEALFAGPISGASMNPVRSLAPALVAWQWSHLWIYLVAPPLGAMIAVVGCRCVRDEGCCCPVKEGASCPSANP